MEVIRFDECNVNMGPPDGMTEEEVETIPVHVGKFENGMPCTTVCLKLSDAELAEVQRTGVVWLQLMTPRMPPIYMSVLKPFEEPQPEKAPACGSLVMPEAGAPFHCGDAGTADGEVRLCDPCKARQPGGG